MINILMINWMYSPVLCSDGWEQKNNYPDNTPCILKLFTNCLDTPRTLTLKSNISISVTKFPWKNTKHQIAKKAEYEPLVCGPTQIDIVAV